MLQRPQPTQSMLLSSVLHCLKRLTPLYKCIIALAAAIIALVSCAKKLQSTAAANAPLFTFGGFTEHVNEAVISPNGTILALAVDQSVRLISTKNWDTKQVLYSDLSIQHIAFSTDGNFLAARGKGFITVWNILSRRRIVKLTFNGDFIFLPNDNMLLVGDNHASLLTNLKGTHASMPIRTAKYWGHTASLCVSPDGRTIAIGGLDTVELLNVGTWHIESTLKGFWRDMYSGKDWITSMAFSSNGRLFIAAGLNSPAVVWDTDKWRQLYVLKEQATGFSSVSIKKGTEELMAVNAYPGIQFWHGRNGQRINHIQVVDPGCENAAFSPNGKLILTQNEDGSVRVWNAQMFL